MRPPSPSYPPKPSKKTRSWVLRAMMTLFLCWLGFTLFCGACLWYWQSQPVNYSAFMLWHHLSGSRVSQVWVDGDDISIHAKRAAVASEDSAFIYHHGFDIDGIRTALAKNQKSGQARAGGSTISQQTAKNLFLTSHRSYIRKAQEVVLTLLMESMWDKERILTVYLNVAEFGHGIYGIEAAARHYYGKSAKQLTDAQAAFLISILPNPKYYEKNRRDRRLLGKQKIVMARMNAAHLPKSSHLDHKPQTLRR